VITELSNYVWDKDKQGQTINRPIDDFNHLLDALRYAVEDLGRQSQPRIRGL
jgi:phage terminase large subunit